MNPTGCDMPALPRQKSVPVALGLGANLDDPAGRILAAVERLRAGGLTRLRLSPLYETPPVDCTPGTPPFLNGALTGEWAESAADLRQLARRIEIDLGRPPAHSSREARCIDLDLLLFGPARLVTSELTLPHPRLSRRGFVLVPLADLAADWFLPGTGFPVRAALENLAATGGRTVFPVVCYPPPNL